MINAPTQFQVGTTYSTPSEGDNGEHLRERTGWPYSIYRKNIAVGGVDHVLCHGIQHEGDAEALCHILNLRIAGAAQ